MRIYITHCCAKKEPALRYGIKRVPPDKLYTATPTQRFMKRCQNCRVKWAIFSDRFGVWFPEVEHEWYEKDPDTVTEAEFDELVKDFDTHLRPFDKIMFYYNPGRFHRLYRRLIGTTGLREKVKLFSHLHEIVK